MIDTVKLRSQWKKNELVFRALGYSLSDSPFTKPAQTKKNGRNWLGSKNHYASVIFGLLKNLSRVDFTRQKMTLAFLLRGSDYV